MTSKLKVSDGDWICGNKQCANVNFARRSSCNKCGESKGTSAQVIKQTGAEIGKNFANKSKGLFSADDWQCSKCSNINWARRVTCNVCNAKKFGTEETRTGIGGGFNERMGVEYNEQVESDGEYDEFGRKKKKFRKQDEIEQIIRQSGEDTNDKEDNDDDEDVSKYALDEDDDEDDDENVDLSKYDMTDSESGDSTPGKRKRSRSKSSSPTPKKRSRRSRSGSRGSSSNSSSGSSSSSSSSSDSDDDSAARSSKRK